MDISAAEKKKHQEQIAAFEARQKKLTKQLEEAKLKAEELIAAKGENASLQQKLDAAVTEADGLRKRLAIRAEVPATSEGDAQDATLRSEMALLDKELTDARLQLKTTRAEMSEAQLQHDKRQLELNNQVQKLETELESKQLGVAAPAVASVGADPAATAALEKELAAAKNHEKHYHKKAKSLKAKLTAATDARDKLQKQLEASENEKASKLGETEIQLREAQAELAATQQQIAALSSETEDLKARLKAKSGEGGVSAVVPCLSFNCFRARV